MRTLIGLDHSASHSLIEMIEFRHHPLFLSSWPERTSGRSPETRTGIEGIRSVIAIGFHIERRMGQDIRLKPGSDLNGELDRRPVG